MQGLRMVPVTRVSNGFHARVIAARLGSEGIVTQLRGGIDTPYPAGAVEVLVDQADLPVARDLLLADEVEDAFADAGIADDDLHLLRPRRLAAWVAGALAALLVVAEVVSVVARR